MDFGVVNVTENNKIISVKAKRKYKNIFQCSCRTDFYIFAPNQLPSIDFYGGENMNIYIPPEMPIGNNVYWCILGVI